VSWAKKTNKEREKMGTNKDKAPGLFLPSSHEICPAPGTHKLSHLKNSYNPLPNSSAPPPLLLFTGEKERVGRERKRGCENGRKEKNSSS